MSCRLSVVLLGLIIFSLSYGLVIDKEPSRHRSKRFLPLFPFYTIGRFSEDVCTATNQLTGFCTVKGDCADLGGIPAGSCPAANTKQATCCVLQKACGGSSQVNNTYFYNPRWPQTFPGGEGCTYRVTRASTDICQLRVSFLDFSLAQPTGDGVCSIDYMAITGGSSRVPRICGENAGQHVYVDFNGNNPISIQMATTSTYAFARHWNLQMTQIECASTNKAPSGCLQYYTDTTGEVRSFNYATAANPAQNAQGVSGTRQIANMKYAACVRAGANMCTITWSQPTTDPYAFTVTGDVDGIDPAILGTTAVMEQTCTTDYVIIPAPNDGTVNLPSDRFCGLGLPSIIGQVTPFIIYSVTDANEANDIANRGFYLQYTQNTCPV